MAPTHQYTGQSAIIAKKPHGKRPLEFKAISEAQSARLHEIAVRNPTMKALFSKAYQGRSKAAALKAKCLDCSCFQRKEVTLCTVQTCPLWHYRPFQKESNNE